MSYSLWRQNDLPELVVTLAARPGHETVCTLVADLLRHGFRAAWAALDHEVRMLEVRGRADMLFGATVFEFKSDLRRELGDTQARPPGEKGEKKDLKRGKKGLEPFPQRSREFGSYLGAPQHRSDHPISALQES